MIEIQIRRPCSKPGVHSIGIAIHCTECGAHTYTDLPENIEHKQITEWVEIGALKSLMGLTFFGSAVRQERDELRADKERLDFWLNYVNTCFSSPRFDTFTGNGADDPQPMDRAAIDAARTAQPEGRSPLKVLGWRCEHRPVEADGICRKCHTAQREGKP